MLSKLIKNKSVIYLSSRYATMAIQFVNSILIAIALGPYYLGIWGFVQLIIQYMQQLNFGIANSANILLALNPENKKYGSGIYGNSLFLTGIISIFVSVALVVITKFSGLLNADYQFEKYVWLVVIIGILNYVLTLMANVFRVYGRIIEIALFQTIYPVLVLFVVIFYKGNAMIEALLITNIVAFVISGIVFCAKSPLSIKWNFNKSLIAVILKKGWFLFVYATSIYFILIFLRTAISSQYRVEDFGMFTFAFVLANSCLLLLTTMSYLIFPKMINHFSKINSDGSLAYLGKFRKTFVTLAFFILLLAVCFYPVLLMIAPQYKASFLPFVILALAMLLQFSPFALTDFLLAKSYDKFIAITAAVSLLITTVFLFLFIRIFKLPFAYIAFASMIGFLFFYLAVAIKIGMGIEKKTLIYSLNEILHWALILPLVATCLCTVFNLPYFCYIIITLVFISLNYRELIGVFKIMKLVVSKPEVVDI